ncbi:hypothetical protein [Rubrivirga sp.]|uniref:hypothetical protein n=1 Tax=Rubrivirga sp. TaxID=1885344 RepID=UPI003B5171E8
MTLKTVTGPSIRDALADARRLFGADVVMLQSAPAAHGHPASVTVAFDTAPAPGAPSATRPVARPPATPAVPEPVAEVAPRAYGYGAVRNMRPPVQESVAAPGGVWEGGSVREAASPSPSDSDRTGPEPAVTAAEVASLRARLAELEAALAEVRASAPVPVPSRAPVVFVGPGGSGKTSLALRLARAPALVGAERPAALIVAPETERTADPAPLFWAVGVPVAVVQTADDVREALRTFADADVIVVDTPALPLAPERARPAVARLGEVLAPLGTAEVHLVIDATRSAATLGAATIGDLGLRPDALALTRLDEAPGAEATWTAALGLPLRLVAAGPDDLALATQRPALPSAPPFPRAAPMPTAPTQAAPTPTPVVPTPAAPTPAPSLWLEAVVPAAPATPVQATPIDLRDLVWAPLDRPARAEASSPVFA